MDIGAWQATVHGVAESDMTELLNNKQSHSEILYMAPQSLGSGSTKHAK